MNYTINALFFDGDTMHNIYISKGSFDFLYELPKTIYSTLISSVLNNILGNLALSNGSIIEFKQNNSKDNLIR